MNYLTINGWEVEYEYDPAERQTMDYPGCPEEVRVQKVICKGKNIIGIIDLEEVESKILNYDPY